MKYVKTFEAYSMNETSNISEATGREAMRDLTKEVSPAKLKKAFKGKKHEYFRNGKTAESVYFNGMQKGDVCNPITVEYKDGSREDFYGYDVLRILDDFKLIEE